ncbi:nucleotidyltransferase family protein [uncultured Dubosiella sp.]|uniref:nucleotidyltransferase family protein n=1 Tax=uncultured Dubosiella sp. TaxID=1937011 RepID=UPI00272FF204|nr:nucleotidyltransferase family protein [uncultured Dubosiella sp.]
MKTCGIIVEYNPLHAGHLHHLQQARQVSGCSVLVVVLSSYFTQRALPSLIEPYQKARLAIEHGADIVVELPAVYAAQSADRFARNAIDTLRNLHVDGVCFGSETNDIDELERQLAALNALEANPGTSWQKNIGARVRPNDILGMQYIRYARQAGITPLCIQRDDRFKSATKTRDDFFSGSQNEWMSEWFLPEQRWESYYPYLRTFLQMSAPAALSKLFLVNEGIEHRLIENAKKHADWNGFLNASISKTYTKARIQRTCLFLMLQITKEQMREHERLEGSILLACNETGRKYLNTIKKDCVLYSKFAQMPPFLKEVRLKTKALYESVMTHPVKEELYVR